LHLHQVVQASDYEKLLALEHGTFLAYRVVDIGNAGVHRFGSSFLCLSAESGKVTVLRSINLPEGVVAEPPDDAEPDEPIPGEVPDVELEPVEAHAKPHFRVRHSTPHDAATIWNVVKISHDALTAGTHDATGELAFA
jgi:hypothetical protein